MVEGREVGDGGIEERKGGNADSVAQIKFRNRRLYIGYLERVYKSSFFCFLFLCREEMMRERESQMH